MIRLTAMYYINVQSFLGHPEKDWEKDLSEALQVPPELPEQGIEEL